MSPAAELKSLERRRQALVERNDHLREVFADRCSEMTDPSFWMREGVAMAQNALTSGALLSTLMSVINKFRK